MKKSVVKIILFAPAVIAVLAVVLTGVLQVFLNTETAGALIRKHLNAAIPGRVEWEKHDVSILHGRVRMQELEIFDPEGQQVITLENLYADIGLADLFRRTVLVESAIISKPGIFLKTASDGRLNIAKAFAEQRHKPEPDDEEETGAPAFNVRISSLAVEDGTFSFQTPGQDETPGLRVFLENFDIHAEKADLADRSGRLKVSVIGGLVNTESISAPIGRFFLDTTLAGDELQPLALEFKTGNSSIAASGKVSGVFTQPVPEIRLDALADLSEIRRILGLKQDFSGMVALNASAEGDPANPLIAARLNAEDLHLSGTDLPDTALETLLQDGLVEIRNLETRLGGGTVRTTGTVDLGQAFSDGFTAAPTDLEAIRASLDLDIPDLPFSVIPGMGGFQGRLSGRIGVDSTGVTPENIRAAVDADLQARGFSPSGGIKPFDIDLSSRALMDEGTVNIESMKAEGPAFGLFAEGSYDIFQNLIDLKTRVDIPDPGVLAEKFGISGVLGESAALDAEVSGNPGRPSVDAVLRAKGPGFGNTAIDTLEAGIGFSGGRLDLSRVRIESGSSAIRASGLIKLLDADTFRPEPDPDIEFTVDTNNMRIQDFVPGLSGSLKLSGSTEGSLKNPSGSFTAEARDLETGVQTIRAASLVADLRDRKIHLEPLEVSLEEQQSLSARGWISSDLQYELRASSDPIALGSIEQLSQSGLEGWAEITAQGRGSLDNPSADALIRVSGLALDGRRIPDTEISAGLEDRAASVSIDNPFRLDAAYNLSDQEFSAAAELAETELEPFFKIAGLEGFSGSVSATLKTDGNARDLENSRAKLTVSDLQVLMEEEEIAAARGFEMGLENRKITIPATRVDLLKDGYIHLQGTGSLDRDIDVTAEGVFPAKLAEGLADEIESPEGVASIEAMMSGSVDNPDFSADITLDGLGFTLASTMQKLHSINGRINITDKKSTVSGLAGKLDDGEFSLDGEAGLENFIPVSADMDISARRLPVHIPDMMEMRIDTDLKLAGTPDDSLLSGEIMLIEGLYFKDVNMSLVEQAGDIGKRRRRSPARSSFQMPDLPFLKNLSIDVSVGHRNPFMVDNNLALLSIRPQLTVGGSAENPVITGRAEISEGTVAYRNTEFEVVRGVVDFIDPYRIEPEVDIRAESEIRQWTITLAISGTPENLDFQLSSNPAEEDADIISLLAAGKTTREMAGSGGGGVSPERMLADLVGGRLEKQVKEGTGLDIVEVEYTQRGSESEAEQEVRVTVGKELSRRLMVKYGVERKSGEMVQQSTGVYRLLENLSANAYQDTAGSFGGEMRYRLEFR